jgi:hypothetical protein
MLIKSEKKMLTLLIDLPQLEPYGTNSKKVLRLIKQIFQETKILSFLFKSVVLLEIYDNWLKLSKIET